MTPVLIEAGETSTDAIRKRKRVNRGISILDLILRIFAILGTLGSAIAMGTTDETLPFLTQFFQFRAQYNDLPMFTAFVVLNAVVCGYLFLSLPVSILHIIRSMAKVSRLILIIFDTVMLALLTAASSGAAAIVYLAHKGNTSANWPAICQQFNNFCDRITGSLIGSFVAVIGLVFMVIASSMALSRC